MNEITRASHDDYLARRAAESMGMSWREYNFGPEHGADEDTFTEQGHTIRFEFEWSLEVEEDVDEDFDDESGRKRYRLTKSTRTEISLGKLWIDDVLDEDERIGELMGADWDEQLKEMAKEAL